MTTKPTSVRLDPDTLARAEAIRVQSKVPITTSAVLQEAVRRGLAELEGEGAKPSPRMTDAEIAFYRARIREGLTPLLGEHYAAVAAGDTELKFKDG